MLRAALDSVQHKVDHLLHPEHKDGSSSTSDSTSSSTSDSTAPSTTSPTTPYLSSDELSLLHRWWSACNYLTIGQIYLQDNPLLTRPLTPADIKPRLLGHWGTSPGLSFLYTHTNRVIRSHSLNAIFLTGPGHGGPALVAAAYLESTYTDVYPAITRDADGLRRLFRQFSTPGGIPSHVSPPTPGSIHEGGELGYVLTHAFGAVMDNPDLLAIAVVGDGEAETGPLEGSWKSISYLNPVGDGAVLPILHLNGYKISGPTVLGRDRDSGITALLTGHGYKVHWVEGEEPEAMHHALAQTMDTVIGEIHAIQRTARAAGKVSARPTWPCIVLRSPKGWTGPKVVDGVKIEGTFRAHQVPLTEVKTNDAHLRVLETWMKSYNPTDLFDDKGTLKAELAALPPTGTARMSANPHTNAGHVSTPLVMPDIKQYAYTLSKAGVDHKTSTTQLGLLLRDLYLANPKTFRLFCPDETNSNKLGAVFEVEKRCLVSKVLEEDEEVSTSGRVMEVLSEHLCEGWLEGYTLTGRHGLFASYEAFSMIVASMVSQHIKCQSAHTPHYTDSAEPSRYHSVAPPACITSLTSHTPLSLVCFFTTTGLEVCSELPWRTKLPSLNILLTSTCWRNDHNGFSHQGPGFMDTLLTKQGLIARVYLPPDANCLLAVSDHCFRSQSYVNVIIIDKQPQLQYLSLDDALAHAKAGISIWRWASNDSDAAPADLIFGCCGDIPTMETLAAVSWLRKKAPHLRLRVVNVIDALSLYLPERHPHGVTRERFVELFTESTEVVFAFHGYPGAVHMLIHGRPRVDRFHVRGYNENGTTTTPFDMVVLNRMSRFHLIKEGLKRLGEEAKGRAGDVTALAAECDEWLKRHHEYTTTHFDDLPEIKEWVWDGRQTVRRWRVRGMRECEDVGYGHAKEDVGLWFESRSTLLMGMQSSTGYKWPELAPLDAHKRATLRRCPLVHLPLA